MTFYFTSMKKAETFRRKALTKDGEFVGPVEVTESGAFFSVTIEQKADHGACPECAGLGYTVGILDNGLSRRDCETCWSFIKKTSPQEP